MPAGTGGFFYLALDMGGKQGVKGEGVTSIDT